MQYEFSGRLSDIIGYYREVKTKYGKRYWEFDPLAIARASALFVQMSSTFKKDYYKALKLNKINPPDRIQVESIDFPISCGINFSRQFAIQIQKQIEEKTSISKIHMIPGVFTILKPFRPNRDWRIDDTFIVNETIEGKRCSFFQTQILCNKDVGLTCKLAIPLVWIRCWYPNHTEKEVDFWDENEPITFEICDGPPDSFPDFYDLPDFILQRIESAKKNPMQLSECSMDFSYEKWTYDRSQAWIDELKSFFNTKTIIIT